MPLNSKYLAPFEAGAYYHIYNRTATGQKMFLEDKNYDYFLELAGRHLSKHLDFYAYCLLPNHFHFLISVKESAFSEELDNIIINQFRKFFIAYTKALNNQYKLHGGVFSTPFRRIKLDSDEYLTTLIAYIHRNPVSHNVCSSLDYKFSSYGQILEGNESLLAYKKVLKWFGNEKEFVDFHAHMPEMTSLRKDVISRAEEIEKARAR